MVWPKRNELVLGKANVFKVKLLSFEGIGQKRLGETRRKGKIFGLENRRNISQIVHAGNCLSFCWWELYPRNYHVGHIFSTKQCESVPTRR
jgi:hypothetical protein